MTWLATLRWTNNSPGAIPTTWFAGTRLSEQPIHKYSGFCCATSLSKNSGSCLSIRAAHAELFSMSWRILGMTDSLVVQLWIVRRQDGAPPLLLLRTFHNI